MGARRSEGGFTLIEVLVVLVVLSVLAAMAIPNLLAAIQRARTKALVADARALHVAFKRYALDHDGYPPCCTPPEEALDRTTLHPLVRDGYLGSVDLITGKLAGGALSEYDSPDSQGTNWEYYALLRHRSDASLTVLVADTDEWPGLPGASIDGVYVVRDGALLTPDES